HRRRGRIPLRNSYRRRFRSRRRPPRLEGGPPMTTATAQPTSALSGVRLSFLGTLRSEWIKFFAVRSTGWMLLATLVTMLGFSAMMAAGMRMGESTDQGVQVTGDPAMAAFEPGIMSVTFSYGVAQIVIAVLGALAMTGEFSTGRI